MKKCLILIISLFLVGCWQNPKDVQIEEVPLVETEKVEVGEGSPQKIQSSKSEEELLNYSKETKFYYDDSLNEAITEERYNSLPEDEKKNFVEFEDGELYYFEFGDKMMFSKSSKYYFVITNYNLNRSEDSTSRIGKEQKPMEEYKVGDTLVSDFSDVKEKVLYSGWYEGIKIK